MGIMAGRVLAGISSLGLSEIGFKVADDKLKERGFKGGVGELQQKSDEAMKLGKEQEGRSNLDGFPATSPDLTDEVVRKRRAAAAMQLMLGRGRAGTFSDNPMGDMRIGRQMLGGGP